MVKDITCKWEQSNSGFKQGINCLNPHADMNKESNEVQDYQCAGLKYTWKVRKCVKEHKKSILLFKL